LNDFQIKIGVKLEGLLVIDNFCFDSEGRIQHLFGDNIQAMAYLKQGLQIVELLQAPEEEAKINHFLGLTLWRQDDLESAESHLEKSIQILERVRETAPWQSELSLRLFDREIASYQALQRILVLVGRTDEALLFAERARTIPHLNLRKGGAQSTSRPPIRTVDELSARVNQLRSAVLYFSLVGTVLFSWLLIPGRGIYLEQFHTLPITTFQLNPLTFDPIRNCKIQRMLFER